MSAIAFLFPGQGSQYPGMGSGWVRHPSVLRTFEEAESALGIPLRDICFQGDSPDLSATEIAQPAILTVSVAAFRLLREEFGLEPAWMAGHSLGEITALVCSESMGFDQAVKLVRARGLLMRDAGRGAEGTMTAVEHADVDRIQAICAGIRDAGGSVWISNFNGSDQNVLSGRTASVAKAEDLLRSEGALCIPLRVKGAFHSPLMEPMVEAFRTEIARCRFSPSRWPVISSVTGMLYFGSDQMGGTLERQLVQPVLWSSVMEFLSSAGCRRGIEVGPGKVLRNLARKRRSEIEFLSFDAKEDAERIPRVALPAPGNPRLPQADPCMDGRKLLRLCLGAVASTRNRNWGEDAYRAGVLVPMQRLKELERLGAVQGIGPGTDACEEALGLLMSILQVKGVPKLERESRLASIFGLAKIQGTVA